MAKPYVPYDGPIVTRAFALENGLKRYFTGNLCRRGHVSERFTSSRKCLHCGEEWIEQNPAKRSKILKDYYHNNIDKEKARGFLYRSENKEKIRDKSKAYYHADPAKNNSRSIAWQRANPEKMKAINATKLANRIARMSGDRYSAKDVREIGSKQLWKCDNCLCCVKYKYHVDHVMPLVKGGRNIKENLAILCPKCNMKKKAKDPIDWARENGRLL